MFPAKAAVLTWRRQASKLLGKCLQHGDLNWQSKVISDRLKPVCACYKQHSRRLGPAAGALPFAALQDTPK